jgi:hypothetical protein
MTLFMTDVTGAYDMEQAILHCWFAKTVLWHLADACTLQRRISRPIRVAGSWRVMPGRDLEYDWNEMAESIC